MIKAPSKNKGLLLLAMAPSMISLGNPPEKRAQVLSNTRLIQDVPLEDKASDWEGMYDKTYIEREIKQLHRLREI